ncbi:MAG TPA: hypothetical protein VFX23_01375, partial [Limnobacter sp.]|uniref:hypothetical protein n=1 Tax=Limnobacter sp. TaxID=2003368 RepID=UPI002E31573B
VVVAAGDTQLTSVNGLDLISNMFELERNTAVLPTDEVKNQLVNNVRALFVVDDQGALTQDTGFASQIRAGRYSDDFTHSVPVDERPKGLAKLSPFASQNFRNAQQTQQMDVQNDDAGQVPANDQGAPANGAAAQAAPAAPAANAAPAQRQAAIAQARAQVGALSNVFNALSGEARDLVNNLRPLGVRTRLNPNNHNLLVEQTRVALDAARIQARGVLGRDAPLQDIEATQLVTDARNAHDQAEADLGEARARLAVLQGDENQAGSIAEAVRDLRAARQQLNNLSNR